MFLTCPQCDTNFSAPDEAILPDGAKVRCSECKKIWFQEPIKDEIEGEPAAPISADDIDALFDTDSAESDAEDETDFAEVLANAEEGVPDDALAEEAEESTEEPTEEGVAEDIPESLKSGPDEDIAPINPKSGGKFKLSKAQMTGYGAAIILFILLLVVAILIRPAIVTSSPGANSFYSLFGFSPIAPSKSIVFHEIITETKGENLHVRGSLINLSKKTVALPMIAAIQLDKDGNEVTHEIIAPPVHELAGEETYAFEFMHPRHEDAEGITLSLTLKKGGEDNKDTRHEETDDHGAASKAHHEDNTHTEKDNHAEPSHDDPHDTHDSKASPAHAPAKADLHSSPAH